ncbi:ABC transporter permease subunit [Calothrix sp. PCC 6303]|uniref:ABC transporter permease subunit n=1 Tax=Calothrix sp. PCC 6303 TaxID=1170562 RepID=UPI0002A014F3|nr:ABC transporter permease subunit [Calothrix sp. PCC 6303]AFZ03432.1 hypothetical protein Cal6303_4532 [Calothrix sp. PCC 6303]
MLNILDKIGDWNPQLMRELKGRVKLFPVLITTGISFLLQGILFLLQITSLPGEKYSVGDKYCKLGEGYRNERRLLENAATTIQNEIYKYSSKINYDAEKLNLAKEQLKINKLGQDKINNILSSNNVFCPQSQIDYTGWWTEHNKYMFLALTGTFVFVLLIAGTYLLINNLTQEERKGTLNFIRLSPQSESSILLGKMLGIPILIYILVGTAIPFHAFVGLSLGFNLIQISLFYLMLGACCFFFYSGALLFALVSQFYRGLQPWLGSGAVMFFLYIISATFGTGFPLNHAAVWIKILVPWDSIIYLFPNLSSFNSVNYSYSGLMDSSNSMLTELQKLQFFFIPVGSTLFGFIAISLANFGFWSYWIWQGLLRRFRNPNATVISKVQSYWLVASFQVILWGFTLQHSINSYYPHTEYSYKKVTGFSGFFDLNQQIIPNLFVILFFNIVLLTGLTIILSPQRQTVQDWARYHTVSSSSRQGWWKNSKLRDLLLTDKSISVGAIALNLGITLAPAVVWLLISPSLNIHQTDSLDVIINEIGRFKSILAIGMFVAIAMIYVTIFQRMLMLKTAKRYFWAVGTITALAFIPPIMLCTSAIDPTKYPLHWLISTFPWAGVYHSSTPEIMVVLLAQIGVLIFLFTRLTNQVRLAGESSTQALLKNKTKV